MSYILYDTPTEQEFWNAPSESARYRHLTASYLAGCGVDIGSQGAPVVPWAISFDLPPEQFARYCNGQPAKGPIHLTGYAWDLPFADGSLDFIYSSHLIEDFNQSDQRDLFRHWMSKIKHGGTIVTLAPEKLLWSKYLASGGVPNPNHKHEPYLGELTDIAKAVGLLCVLERTTDVYPRDYTVMAVMKKA